MSVKSKFQTLIDILFISTKLGLTSLGILINQYAAYYITAVKQYVQSLLNH